MDTAYSPRLHEEELSAAASQNGWGTNPAKRAFYRAFRDFNPLNDLGIG